MEAPWPKGIVSLKNGVLVIVKSVQGRVPAGW